MILDRKTLAMMQKTQESAMHHKCTVEAYIVAEDGTISYGKPAVTVCGFENHAGSAGDNVFETIEAAAAIRFPLSFRIGMKDRVTLTESFGKPVDPPQVYQVCRLPASGPSGQVVEVTEVWS